MWPELKRKAFHLLALIYVIGVVMLPRFVYLKYLVQLLLLMSIFEIVRLKNAAVNEWLLARYGGLFREQEHHALTGAFWMVLGVTVSALLVEPLPLLVTALLYLILGDAVASLVGKRLQGPRWPGSEKRFSGSLACFVVCLVIGATLLRPAYAWHGVVIGALAATLIEWSVLPVNDNFTIPVGSSLVLLACYQVRPLSFFFN